MSEHTADYDAWWLDTVPDRDAFGSPRYVLVARDIPPASTEAAGGAA